MRLLRVLAAVLGVTIYAVTVDGRRCHECLTGIQSCTEMESEVECNDGLCAKFLCLYDNVEIVARGCENKFLDEDCGNRSPGNYTYEAYACSDDLCNVGSNRQVPAAATTLISLILAITHV